MPIAKRGQEDLLSRWLRISSRLGQLRAGRACPVTGLPTHDVVARARARARSLRCEGPPRSRSRLEEPSWHDEQPVASCWYTTEHELCVHFWL